MKKIILLLSLLSSILSQAQVSTLPHSIGIGQNTLSTIPFHINKNGEVARFQGTSPYVSFYEGGNWNGYVQAYNNVFALGTKNTFDLNFYTDDLLRLRINASNGQVYAQERFNALSGINLTGPLRVAGNNVGQLGDVLMSLGNGTPVWSSITQNPQIGFQAYLNTSLSMPNNTFVNLNGFIEDYDDGGGFNHATGVYTAPSDGLYFFKVSLLMSSSPNPTFNVFSILRMFKNSTLNQQKNETFIMTQSQECGKENTFFIKLNANDTVDFSFYQSNSNSYNLSLSNYFAFKTISGYKIY